MMPKRAGDDVAGELLARGYQRMLGHLSITEMNELTDLVLEKCKWFPTVAECNELMGATDWSNPFYRARTWASLEANGYGSSNPALTDKRSNPAALPSHKEQHQ